MIFIQKIWLLLYNLKIVYDMYLLPRLMDPKYLHFVIISSMVWSTIDSDVHTSTGELIEVFRMEQELVISIIRFVIVLTGIKYD